MWKAVKRWYYRRTIKVMGNSLWSATCTDHVEAIQADIRHAREKLRKLL